MIATVTGVDKLNIKLEKLIDGTTVTKALTKACAEVEREAKHRCPVGDTGLLRASIASRVEGNVGEVYDPLEYAVYVICAA